MEAVFIAQTQRTEPRTPAGVRKNVWASGATFSEQPQPAATCSKVAGICCLRRPSSKLPAELFQRRLTKDRNVLICFWCPCPLLNQLLKHMHLTEWHWECPITLVCCISIAASQSTADFYKQVKCQNAQSLCFSTFLHGFSQYCCLSSTRDTE